MAAGYGIAGTATAFSGAVAHTLCNIINSATGLVRMTAMIASADGVTASAVPGVLSLFKSTQGAAGTAGGSTITQMRGPTRTVQGTAGYAYTAEPTALTLFSTMLLPQYNGLVVLQFPQGREPEQLTASNGLGVRYTSTATVNAYASAEFEEG